MKAVASVAMILGVLLVGCDGTDPGVETHLVIESYAQVGASLPEVRLRRTLPLSQPYGTDAAVVVEDAEVTVTMDGQSHAYVVAAPGMYRSATDLILQEHAELELEVDWQGHRARASTRIPPPLALDSIQVIPSERPLSGLILDSLFIDLTQIDTLRFDTLRTGATDGYVYLVEVKLRWQADATELGVDDDYWIRTELRPSLSSRTALDDYFLRPEQLLREANIPRNAAGWRHWTGVYAVPVEDSTVVLPQHRLRIALIRSTGAYARFVSGSDSPKFREPLTNVEGALGIFAGMAIDSLSLTIE